MLEVPVGLGDLLDRVGRRTSTPAAQTRTSSRPKASCASASSFGSSAVLRDADRQMRSARHSATTRRRSARSTRDLRRRAHLAPDAAGGAGDETPCPRGPTRSKLMDPLSAPPAALPVCSAKGRLALASPRRARCGARAPPPRCCRTRSPRRRPSCFAQLHLRSAGRATRHSDDIGVRPVQWRRTSSPVLAADQLMRLIMPVGLRRWRKNSSVMPSWMRR